MSVDQRFHRLARAISAVLIALGSTSLLGWIFGAPLLTSVLPGFATMKVNAALSFILAGASLALQIEPSTSRKARSGRVCALVVAAVGALTLAEYIWGVDVGIDQLLIRVPAELQTSSPGRMAPVTALSFTFAGTVLAFLDTRRRVLQFAMQALTISVLLAGFAATAG